MKEIADALQEAHDLLERIHSAYSDRQGDISMYPLRKTLAVVKSALAKPLRNCDVGTPKEQTERFKNVCRKYRRGPGPRANCKGCPIQYESPQVGCTFAWAQMNYVEGETDGQK